MVEGCGSSDIWLGFGKVDDLRFGNVKLSSTLKYSSYKSDLKATDSWSLHA